MCLRKIIQDRKVPKGDKAQWETKDQFQPGLPGKDFKKDIVFVLDLFEIRREERKAI